MLRSAVRTHYLIHLEASWPDSHVFNCSVPATIVKQTMKHFPGSNIAAVQVLAPSKPEVMTLGWKRIVPSHVSRLFLLTFQEPGGKQSITIKTVLEVRWQHCLNESKVKTAERCSPMSPQTKAKSWQAENPDGPSRPSQASKGADEEMLCPEVADFLHPGTMFTGEGHMHSLNEIAEGEFWCDTRWAFVTVTAILSRLSYLSFAF